LKPVGISLKPTVKAFWKPSIWPGTWKVEEGQRGPKTSSEQRRWLAISASSSILVAIFEELDGQVDGKLFIHHHKKTINIEINRRKLNCLNVQNVEPMYRNQRRRGKWRVALTSQEREWNLKLGFTNAPSVRNNSVKC
jgi:hypothetical protein